MPQNNVPEHMAMRNNNRVAINTGHLQDIQSKIKLIDFNASIDIKPTSIDEGESLRYWAPRFSATATVEMAPRVDSHKWQIGFIQACTEMKLECTYGSEGIASWEIPELTSGMQKMVCDNTGTNYPWYNETFTFPNKMDSQTTTVSMEDLPGSTIDWYDPVNYFQGVPTLTHISRRQSFYVWLVITNLTTEKPYILKTLKWNMTIDIDVDTNRPLGQRARLVSNSIPIQPQVLDTNIPVPRCAGMAPNTNSAQMLMWRPRVGEPTCLVPPGTLGSPWIEKPPENNEVEQKIGRQVELNGDIHEAQCPVALSGDCLDVSSPCEVIADCDTKVRKNVSGWKFIRKSLSHFSSSVRSFCRRSASCWSWKKQKRSLSSPNN